MIAPAMDDESILQTSDSVNHEQMPERDAELARSLVRAYERLTAEIGKRIVGQQSVIEQLLIAVLARGHCLLEGVPGLAKTLMVQSLAETIDLSFRRIQFTPDLMPADIMAPTSSKRDHKASVN